MELCLLLPKAFVDAKGLDATKLIREVAKEIQGGGGGQKTLCVAGGQRHGIYGCDLSLSSVLL